MDSDVLKNDSKKIELLPDDDATDLFPPEVENTSTLKVSCAECSIVGPYSSEDEEVSGEVTLQIMRMDDCGHGIVYGVLDEKIRERIKVARSQQRTFMQLATAGDKSGAQRTYRKMNKTIKSIKILQHDLWGRNKHKTSLKAIPELQ